MFDPPDVVTVWIALDTMDAELGPLEYVRGSHFWKSTSLNHGPDATGGVGRATKQFFDSQRGGRDLLYAAAADSAAICGVPYATSGSTTDASSPDVNTMILDVVSMVGLQAGALSIHHGMTWHGSGPNRSHRLSSQPGCPPRPRPRRGLGVHYVPANVKFTRRAIHSKLWKKYVSVGSEATVVDDPSCVDLPESEFPIVWRPCSSVEH
jgi:phytanoyl-CoA hydroxylase